MGRVSTTPSMPCASSELTHAVHPLPRTHAAPPQRVDFWLTNCRNERLRCSHWLPDNFDADTGKAAVVVYCHCNSGSRRDAEEALFVLLPAGISVFSMDFVGSGLSDGSWVTLGAKEVDDLEAVVTFLRRQSFVTTIGLWGRSMGAVTSLMYAQRDPSIAGMVLDSPFSRLTDLMAEIVAQKQIAVPKGLLKFAIAMMKRSVRKRAGFDIGKVAPVDFAAQTFIPALYAHAVGDDFVPKHHSETLHELYGGDKNYGERAGVTRGRPPPRWCPSERPPPAVACRPRPSTPSHGLSPITPLQSRSRGTTTRGGPTSSTRPCPSSSTTRSAVETTLVLRCRAPSPRRSRGAAATTTASVRCPRAPC